METVVNSIQGSKRQGIKLLDYRKADKKGRERHGRVQSNSRLVGKSEANCPARLPSTPSRVVKSKWHCGGNLDPDVRQLRKRGGRWGANTEGKNRNSIRIGNHLIGCLTVCNSHPRTDLLKATTSWLQTVWPPYD